MNHNGNGNGRTKKGTFAPGNKLSPGRKPRATEKEYLEVTIANCTLTDWKKICKKATADAAQGDRQAREWLGKIILPTLNDRVEMEQYRDNEEINKEFQEEVISTINACDPLMKVRLLAALRAKKEERERRLYAGRESA